LKKFNQAEHHTAKASIQAETSSSIIIKELTTS